MRALKGKTDMSLLDSILGKPLASSEEDEQKIGVLAGIPVLGLDGLSSAAYGPEAALTVLLPLGAAGLAYIGPIILVILVILGILYLSYRQTIAAYPGGGGSYTVARENLGARAGLLAAAALMIDYILNVSVGISAGIGALISAVPSLQPHVLVLCLVTLALITLVNLRGVRETGFAFGIPTYLFVGTLIAVIALGVFKAATHSGDPQPVTAPPAIPAGGATVSLWLLLRSFASGCTAMTGVEAVSNGVSAFAKPAVKNAHRTLTAIVGILGLLLAGIAYLARVYHIGAMDQESPGYQSIISQLVAAVAGRGVFYYITIGSVLTVLALSANTSFADFPRLCRLIARDGYLPNAFEAYGRRLVHSFGILILAILAGLLLIIFGGITDRLIPLFAIGAFGAFTLSQAGMVVHWRRLGGRGSRTSLAVNAIGATATCAALIVILLAKFVEGAWITLLLIPIALFIFYRVKRHYDHVASQVACPAPLDLSSNDPPVVVVPVVGWNLLTQRALRFGLRLSPDVIAVHVSRDQDNAESLRREWTIDVQQPISKAGFPDIPLEIVASPYRLLVKPLVGFIDNVKERYPERLIAIIVPELIESHWYEFMLHNHRAKWLKADLWLQGDPRVVIITVPWYLSEKDQSEAASAK
jgi:amino acid transporter